jgi:hypothetical protein
MEGAAVGARVREKEEGGDTDDVRRDAGAGSLSLSLSHHRDVLVRAPQDHVVEGLLVLLQVLEVDLEVVGLFPRVVDERLPAKGPRRDGRTGKWGEGGEGGGLRNARANRGASSRLTPGHASTTKSPGADTKALRQYGQGRARAPTGPPCSSGAPPRANEVLVPDGPVDVDALAREGRDEDAGLLLRLQPRQGLLHEGPRARELRDGVELASIPAKRKKQRRGKKGRAK